MSARLTARAQVSPAVCLLAVIGIGLAAGGCAGMQLKSNVREVRAIAVTKQAEAASKSTRVTPATEREEPAAPKRSEPE